MPPSALTKLFLEVTQKLICIVKVQNFSGITLDLPFTEYDFYDMNRRTFEKSELRRSVHKLPLHKMAESMELRNSMRVKNGRRSYFTPEGGKVARMFLKMYTGLSSPKRMEQLNGKFTTGCSAM